MANDSSACRYVPATSIGWSICVLSDTKKCTHKTFWRSTTFCMVVKHINTNSHHVLYQFLPPKTTQRYNTRPRHHNFSLIEQSTDLNHRDFFIRMLYTVSHKRETILLSISLLNIDGFSQFFHRRTQLEICNKIINEEYVGERIVKIGQYLAKIWTRVSCLPFLTHCV